MIPIIPIDDAHAALVIAALNEFLRTGFIGGMRDGPGAVVDGGDGGNGLSCAPIHWTTDAACWARRNLFR
jgi:hypothetical protein